MARDDGERVRLLKLVHVAVRKLGLEDADYRAILRRVADVDSAKDCSVPQLRRLMLEFRRLGFGDERGQTIRANLAGHPTARKARALWISLHALGVVDDPSERALEALGKRQLGVDRLHWADQSQGARLIEALKAMAERAGWSQQLPARTANRDAGRILKVRLVALLRQRLRDAGHAVNAIDPDALADTDLDAAALFLGGRWRVHLMETGVA